MMIWAPEYVKAVENAEFVGFSFMKSSKIFRQIRSNSSRGIGGLLRAC